MNLYMISQSVNTGYDTYDSAVVAARDEDAARKIHPSGDQCTMSPRTDYKKRLWWKSPADPYSAWVNDLANVRVKLLGTAARGIKAGVICASFNAG